MVDRACLPGEMVLDAIVIDPVGAIRQQIAGADQDRSDWVRPEHLADDVIRNARERGRYIALRWILNTALGIPLEPFTVWRRPVARREPATQIPGWHAIGDATFWWDGLTEMLRIELEVSSFVTARGLSKAEHEPVTETSGGPGTIVLQGGPMLGVHLSDPNALIDARGLSVLRAANGDGWTPIERVGLPLPPQLAGQSYYDQSDQGPIGSLTDPVSAAVERLRRWGPVVGWPSLAGLPSWEAPDPDRLVAELTDDVLPDLVAVMTAHPPPDVGRQRTADRPPRPLAELRQAFALPSKTLNGGGDNQRSQIITRPLQGLALAVASDTWASLALGFGTGAEPGDVGRRGYDDFMVTAMWRGLIEVPLTNPFPWPWGSPPSPTISQVVERELAAVVLSPGLRDAPDVPAPIVAAPTYPEGVIVVDAPYLSATKVETPRPAVIPDQPRPSAYGLARFDAAGDGRYQMRQHPTAGGWIPIGSTTPVRDPEQVPDPALTVGTVMLRDSGVARPISGASLSYEYAVSATDLFGQWSGWGTGWLALGPASVGVPSVAVVRATASPGSGGSDPCSLAVSAEIVWDASERSASRMRVAVDVFDPYPAPPALLAEPEDEPQAGWTAADITFSFDGSGNPIAVPVGVQVVELHPDDRPVTAQDPSDSTDRRYRVTLGGIATTYGTARDKAVAVYCQVEELVRPGEWGAWGHAREMAIAPNPLPPPTPVPLPPEYPLWASLPNAAGLSYAPVSWASTGAWRYRVYETTEAALLAACGQSGPVLTDGYGVRMQRLFDLHKVAANLPRIKAAYRKLGTEPIDPPMDSGSKRFEALLPRGSNLIHCFIVVGVSEANVISGWPEPDADGRKGFIAYAIPHPLCPPLPEIRAALGSGGLPEVSVTFGGATPVTTITLYRTTSPVRARQVGLMERIATVTPDPSDWRHTVIVDASAPVGWDRVQYRAVGRAADDLDRAGMAVDSPTSKAFALLNPPPGAPDLILSEDTTGASATVAVATVRTSAPRRTVAIGDHTISWSVRAADGSLVRGSVVPPDLADFATVADLLAGPDRAGYVGADLRLRLDRAAGEPMSLTVDVTDPLGRTAHALLEIAGFVPDPAPVIADLQIARHTALLDQAIYLGFEINVPLPPDPGRDWTILIRHRRAGVFFAPTTSRTFGVATLATIPTASDMPLAPESPRQWMIRRVADTGRFLFWVRVGQPQIVTVVVSNSSGQSVSEQQVTP